MTEAISSSNWLSHVIKALFQIFVRNNANYGIIDTSVCPCIEQEYVLSETFKVNIKKAQEITHNFILDPNPFKDCGTLSGKVTDKCGDPIRNALVKVFNLKNEPVTHVFTNKNGEFLVSLPAGRYLVKAVR